MFSASNFTNRPADEVSFERGLRSRRYGRPSVAASRALAHSATCVWWIPSRRSTADFSPCGAASYSANTFARYSAVNDRLVGFGAGSTPSLRDGSAACGFNMITSDPRPLKRSPRNDRGVSPQPDREGCGLRLLLAGDGPIGGSWLFR